MSDPDTATASTFLFADLAGFAALTEAHGDEDAADLAEKFSSAAARILPSYGAEQIKTLGDALMPRVLEPADAVQLGLVLAGELLGGHGYPAVRVGMHHGPAVRRGADWFGATVNVAARISALAHGDEVPFSASVFDGAGAVKACVSSLGVPAACATWPIRSSGLIHKSGYSWCAPGLDRAPHLESSVASHPPGGPRRLTYE